MQPHALIQHTNPTLAVARNSSWIPWLLGDSKDRLKVYDTYYIKRLHSIKWPDCPILSSAQW